MKTVKKLGIEMNHSIACLIEFGSDSFEMKNIESEFTSQDKKQALSKSESVMHHKENQQLSSYYKKLANVIKDYNEVVLFGPTEAKVELFNTLNQGGEFGKIKIEIKNTDKMTENQKISFVKEYFSKA